MSQLLLDQKDIIERYLNGATSPLSSHSFANIFAWQDFFEFDIKILQGCLCVFAGSPIGCFLYLPPLGENVSSDVINECFRIMETGNQGSGVTRVENVGLEQLSSFPENKFSYFKKGYEYGYYRADIASLQGNPYKSKRASYNYFAKNYAHAYVPYNEGMLDECLALYDRWAETRRDKRSEDVYCCMLDESKSVHETVLRHYRHLGLKGRVVLVDGKIRAYTFGFSINRNVFCVLFEISDLSIKGLATYIFSEFCRDDAVKGHKFVNVMDDFGLENVQWTKMSFKPCILWPAYVVTKKKVP